MKQQWQQLLDRIDALTLRERAFLLVSILVCFLAVADAVWLSPSQMAFKQASQRFAAQGVDLQRLRDELSAMAQAVDPSKVVRDDIAAASERLDAINQAISSVAPVTAGNPPIEETLVQLLRQQEGLTLLSTSTIKQEPSRAAANVRPKSGDAAADTPATVLRRGLELRVAGRYADLVRYVQTLETALPALRWGTVQIRVGKETPELTLQVYVVGVMP